MKQQHENVSLTLHLPKGSSLHRNGKAQLASFNIKIISIHPPPPLLFVDENMYVMISEISIPLLLFFLGFLAPGPFFDLVILCLSLIPVENSRENLKIEIQMHLICLSNL